MSIAAAPEQIRNHSVTYSYGLQLEALNTINSIIILLGNPQRCFDFVIVVFRWTFCKPNPDMLKPIVMLVPVPQEILNRTNVNVRKAQNCIKVHYVVKHYILTTFPKNASSTSWLKVLKQTLEAPLHKRCFAKRT